MGLGRNNSTPANSGSVLNRRARVENVNTHGDVTYVFSGEINGVFLKQHGK